LKSGPGGLLETGRGTGEDGVALRSSARKTNRGVHSCGLGRKKNTERGVISKEGEKNSWEEFVRGVEEGGKRRIKQFGPRSVKERIV